MEKGNVQRNWSVPNFIADFVREEDSTLGGKLEGTIVAAAILLFSDSDYETRSEYLEKVKIKGYLELYHRDVGKSTDKMRKVVKKAKARANQARRDHRAQK